MKKMLKILILAITPFIMLAADIPLPVGDLVSDADAILGVRRRAVRRGVIIGSAAATGAAASTTAQQQAATAQQQSATAQQQAATAQQQAATAQQQSATAQQQSAPATVNRVPGNALPIGTVSNALPAGCTEEQISGVEYYRCGPNYYRAAFQGNNLVYVTVQP